jgi:hypothetical protein
MLCRRTYEAYNPLSFLILIDKPTNICHEVCYIKIYYLLLKLQLYLRFSQSNNDSILRISPK